MSDPTGQSGFAPIAKASALALPAGMADPLPHIDKVHFHQTSAAEDRVSTIFQAGRKARRIGDPAAAIAHFREVIRLHPDHVPALNNLANALQEVGEIEEALEAAQRAVSLAPEKAVLHSNLGGLWQTRGDYVQAIAAYRRALDRQPDFFLAHLNLGKVHIAQEAWEAALAALNDALRLQPTASEVHLERGQVFTRLQRPHEALASFEQALTLTPDSARAYRYLSVTLIELHRYHLALLSGDRAIALDPQSAVAYYNRGLALSRLNRCQKALEDNAQAIAIQADYADAHWNASLNHLLLGEYQAGWRHYEWRWRRTGAERQRYTNRPTWTGRESLAGKTILLHSEQGLGDTIQFSRYVPLVAGLGARVLLEVYPSVAPLFTRLPGVSEILPQGESDSEAIFDYHAPLLSLPLAFDTTLNKLPAKTPYLAAPPSRLRKWCEIIGAKTKPRIGISWSGNPDHRFDSERSIALAQFKQILSPRYQWFSLQREVREADCDIPAQAGIAHFGERLHDFSDTAALIAQMDLVISVDTSVAHLAGALGKTTWILLPYNPDWRWMLERCDSPWYPTVRLFRQQVRDDWESVLAAVRNALDSSEASSAVHAQDEEG